MQRTTKLLLMVGAILIVGGAIWWAVWQGDGTATAAQEPTGGGQTGQQRRAVPVLEAAADAKDAPIIVRGIGSVQAFNTVTVKSRVDGNIVKVAFGEGQYVKAGDLLMQIDPRPFQAQLEQAQANEAEDQPTSKTRGATSPALRRYCPPDWRRPGNNTTRRRRSSTS